MKRTVTAHLELHAFDRADLVLSIAVAANIATERETLRVVQDGTALEAREIAGRHETRLHRVDAPAGPITIDYEAVVTGHAGPIATEELDIIEYRRPSRYAPSDSLFAIAKAEFTGLAGKDLLDAVTSWVGTHLSYVPGSSRPTDGAVQTMLKRQGVCRDYAHLVIALLRAHDVPARLVSVYAPGLQPMDFHAVAEAYIDGEWHVVDATALAPRETMVRIATGMDASETAFLSQHHAAVNLNRLTVTAVVDELPQDDVTELVALG
ncbi:transglutaminase domain-containing protein [Aeromicrobium tamlense]|uniref:Transglutaminase domain-containing protein n=1 Tax=Aeromicrobium tamlense TaxID=375541 RepID=A0A8I0FX38_9ACTN|nr:MULTISPECIES: transglutaminase-like domain-containing protein [Aeromicrobium]MBD1270213.1 transglutaminase domain-containing protein [Aeromicrobium tamlense]NYI39129.1 transglutaminase-like putative cysteine protease [Aeromicrobium tamlense]